MVNFAQLRAVSTGPLVQFTDIARRIATELEQCGTDTAAQRNVIASSWAGTDANAAIARISQHAQDYRTQSSLYGRVDMIVTNLVRDLDNAKHRLESAVGMVSSIPGSIDGTGTITINYSALGPNPTPAAVQAAQSRAQQVHGYLCQALQSATEADMHAQSELASLIAPVDAAERAVAARQSDGEEGRDGTGDAQPAPADSGQSEQPDDTAGDTGEEQNRDGDRTPGTPSDTSGDTGDDDDQDTGDDIGAPGVIPDPVGPLNEAQMANAMRIVEVGEALGISERGQAIALATALQESTLRNLANTSLPASLDIPNEGVGSDHDSVGVFQQRPSAGWGSIEECMDVDYAATKFYEELQRVDGWENMELTDAAQAVQRSAFPNAYAKWEDLAYEILAARN